MIYQGTRHIVTVIASTQYCCLPHSTTHIFTCTVVFSSSKTRLLRSFRYPFINPSIHNSTASMGRQNLASSAGSFPIQRNEKVGE